ncbi:DUF4326 domain-containing protein [Streptosporangium sp. NPDC050855]|uniref:DUF4326 domain-containing protein n=1 Tax=Streptosporangium sp. NPDC050855 TaxID=3366194 RepID=UPI0037A52432
MPAEPKRVQLRRTKDWRKPEGAVVVSRPSRWGNPFKIGEVFRFAENDELIMGVVRNHEQAVDLFRRYLAARPDLRDMIRAELAGRDLCCWCKPEDPCHADVLLAVANEEMADA